MPDAAGNIKGIALTGKAGDTLERIFTTIKECDWCPGIEATHEISGCPACTDCWEKAYGLD